MNIIGCFVIGTPKDGCGYILHDNCQTETALLLRGVILSVSLHLFLPNLVMFKSVIHDIFAVIGPTLHIC